MVTRIEVYKRINNERTLLEAVELPDKAGGYDTVIGKLDISYETVSTGREHVALNGYSSVLGGYQSRSIAMDRVLEKGPVRYQGNQGVKHNKEIVVFVEDARFSPYWRDDPRYKK